MKETLPSFTKCSGSFPLSFFAIFFARATRCALTKALSEPSVAMVCRLLPVSGSRRGRKAVDPMPMDWPRFLNVACRS